MSYENPTKVSDIVKRTMGNYAKENEIAEYRLCDHCGMSRVVLRNMRKEDYAPRLETIRRFAKGIGLPTEQAYMVMMPDEVREELGIDLTNEEIKKKLKRKT